MAEIFRPPFTHSIFDKRLEEHFMLGEFFVTPASPKPLPAYRKTFLQLSRAYQRLILYNIQLLAHSLETIIRPQFNERVIITSGFRLEDSRFHGVAWSADFTVEGYSNDEVFKKLDPIWPGGLGKYDGHTHADIRHLFGLFKGRWEGKSR